MSYATQYPLEVLHLVAGQAAKEVCQVVQAPDALVGGSCLSVMSIACQGLFDVRLPTSQIRPVSLFLLVVADSGERKTAVDNLFGAAIHEFDRASSERFDADLVAYKGQHFAWNAIASGQRRQLSKAAQDGQEIEVLRSQLAAHIATEPVRPRRRRVIRQNVSARAVMDALEGSGESIAFMSAEGEVILKGGVMEQMGRLNNAWDGAHEIVIDRADGESVVARQPRVTMAMMVQQAVLKDYIDRHGTLARGSGHWARYLIAWPESKQGFRQIHAGDPVWQFLPPFHARVTELLTEYRKRVATGIVERQVIEFSDEAKARWFDEAARIESQIAPWGHFKDVKDFASKSMEICSRIAALFHAFSKQDGKISLDTFLRAQKFVEWHLLEFKRVFSPKPDLPQPQQDAQTLQAYLESRFFNCGHFSVPKNHVLRNGPIRPEHRLREALDLLVQKGCVRLAWDHRRRLYINAQVPMPGFTNWSGMANI